MKSKCDKCGKRYETYAIILDCNPLSLTSFLEQITNKDGSLKSLCEDCWNKLGYKETLKVKYEVDRISQIEKRLDEIEKRLKRIEVLNPKRVRIL